MYKLKWQAISRLSARLSAWLSACATAQELLDRLGGLTDALLILHQCKPHMAFPQRTEPDPWRYRHQRLLHEELGKLQRASGRVRLGHRRPEEHRSAWRLHRPAGALETGYQRVAALAINLADLPCVLRALPQSDDRGDLQRLENAVVEITLDPRQRSDHLAVAETKSDAPACHVEALRHGVDLHGDFLRARNLQNAGRLVAVEAEVGVGEVVHDHRLVFARQLHDLAEEIEVDAHRGRIVREGDQNQLRLARRRLVEVLQPLQEIGGSSHGQQTGVAFGHD